jgi:23S rRNA pseudouridine1911/1915/1917 synthase
MSAEEDSRPSSSLADAGEWSRVEIGPEEAGRRIDRILALKLDGVGRKLAANLCESGDVLRDGRRMKKSDTPPLGATIFVRMAAWGVAEPAPDVPLNIVLETPDFVIGDKPAGVPTTAIVGRESGTFAGALLARYPEMADVGYGPREPGVLHRLDIFTSGLVVAARTQRAFEALRRTLSQGALHKKYLAVVSAGVLADEGLIESALATSTSDQRRVDVAPDGGGHKCQTRFRIVRQSPRFDLVEAEAPAAYRHQVRFHLASQGAPLVGDTLYGGAAEHLAPRHALHASYIAGEAEGLDSFEAESPLPADLSELLAPG